MHGNVLLQLSEKTFEVSIIWTALLQNPSAGTKRREVFLNQADNAVARIHQSSLDSIHRSKLDSIKSLLFFFFFSPSAHNG